MRLFQCTRAFQTNDAVCVISGSVAELYRREHPPGPEEVDEAIRALIGGGVIDGTVGADRKPLDPYGTPYRVCTVRKGSARKVTVSSAGPDRAFGAADDIAHDAAWEEP